MMKRGTVVEYLNALEPDTLVCVISEVMHAPYYWLTANEALADCNDDINVREVTSTGFYTLKDERWFVMTIDDYYDEYLPDLSYYWVDKISNKV